MLFSGEIINIFQNMFVRRCQVPFYILSRETQKLLLFMIQRSMKPSMLSVGGLYVSAHQVFAQVNSY